MEDTLAVIQSLLERIFGREGASLLMDDLHLALDGGDDGNDRSLQTQEED